MAAKKDLREKRILSDTNSFTPVHEFTSVKFVIRHLAGKTASKTIKTLILGVLFIETVEKFDLSSHIHNQEYPWDPMLPFREALTLVRSPTQTGVLVGSAPQNIIVFNYRF